MTRSQPKNGQERCPTCGAYFDPADAATGRFRPFCSKRCQLIDLGKWLDEEYVISTPILDVGEGLPKSGTRPEESHDRQECES